MAYEGQDIPPKLTKDPANVSADDAEKLLEQQNQLNEGQFSRLNHEYEQCNRTVNYLEQALHSAQIRQQVLGAACERLNAPQTVTPSIR